MGITLKDWLPIPLYLEGRLNERRLRPMEERDRPREADPVDRSTPFPEYRGLGLDGLVGLEFSMGSGTYFDAAARFADFKPQHVFLEELGQSVGDGWTFGLQLGLVWFP